MRALPAVGRILEEQRLTPYEHLVGRDALKRAIREVLEAARADGTSSYDVLLDAIVARVQDIARETLLPAINATGVLLHTNLGRAPLPREAFEDAISISGGYSNLEYDLERGARGSRYARLAEAIAAVSGAEDSLVVNNCAAAVLLVLDTFARDREVIVARNELVEIGGGFRLPDVLARSGARLVEIGTTNRVRLGDVAAALGPRTALILRTHRSNFTMEGFVEAPDSSELAAFAQSRGVPTLEDLGSGALVDLREYGLPHERTVREAIGDGMTLVAFSGDKLLGGPQAGIICGRSAAIARLRSNPLLRALRVDKTTLAMLAATLRLYATPQQRERIPFFAMLAQPLDALRERASQLARAAGGDVVALHSLVGGGSLANARIPSFGVAFRAGEDIVARLRHGFPPVIARLEEGNAFLDLRTVAPEHDAYIAKLLA